MLRSVVVSLAAMACLIALAAPVYADTQDDWHTWGAVVATGPVGENDRLRWWLEGQARFNDDTSRFNQAIARTALGWVVLPRTTVWAGYAWIPTDPLGSPNQVREHRIWQQLTWSTAEPLAGWSISTRTRLEQRIIESSDDTGVRFRQLAKATHDLAEGSPYYISLWDELFVHLNDTDWGADAGIDQNRAFGGLGIRWSDGIRTEVGYMHQFVERSGRDDASNHVLSLTVLLNY